jgi:hypothetical protein
MLITNVLKNEIERIIAGVEEEYRRTKGLILTEDDLKCLIYSRLKAHFRCGIHSLWHSRIPNTIAENELTWRMQTLDQHILASPVHAEIPWYDERHRLAIRPDITILEPGQLSILHGYDGPRIPSKQFEFVGQGIIFELKFIRKKVGIDNESLEDIKQDFNKIKRLFDRLSTQGKGDDMFCYFVIFNKTSIVCNEFIRFIQQNRERQWHKVIYATGKVVFD